MEQLTTGTKLIPCICRRALATMFAHFAQETGGHDPHAGVEQWRQGLVYLREAGCTEEGPGCGYDSSCSLSTWQVDRPFLKNAR